MTLKTFEQKVVLPVLPKEVYDAILSSKQHSAFTGSKANIQAKIGGAFSIFDGGLKGITLDLVPDKKIVQAWKCEMKEWPKDYFSTVVFSFVKQGKQTLLTFTHYGIPASCFSSIKKGWTTYYWDPLTVFFKK